MATKLYNNGGQNTNFVLENTDALWCSGCDEYIVCWWRQKERIETDSAAAPALTGTDAEILHAV